MVICACGIRRSRMVGRIWRVFGGWSTAKRSNYLMEVDGLRTYEYLHWVARPQFSIQSKRREQAHSTARTVLARRDNILQDIPYHMQRQGSNLKKPQAPIAPLNRHKSALPTARPLI